MIKQGNILLRVPRAYGHAVNTRVTRAGVMAEICPLCCEVETS